MGWLIGLDWGTTSFRAYRLGADGKVIEAKSATAGILKVPAGGFEEVFEREIGPWLVERPALPVIAAGMITSRQGWVEVPYCPCPAGSVEIARPISPKYPAYWWAAFVDAGNAADRWTDLDPAVGYGVGLRWRSPVGPLRVDVAYGQRVKAVRVHLSVGIAF